MPTVVIAGGTSPSLGRALTLAILTHAPTWHPAILTRPSSTIPAWLTPLLAQNRVSLHHTTYTDHASLVALLRATQAHTLISVLYIPGPEWFSTQIKLLNAATEAGVKRFAPSEFGLGVQGTPLLEGLAGNVGVWKACEASGIEWMRFECGLFMNYLGFGVPKASGTGDEEGKKREEALGGREGEGEQFWYVTERRAELPVTADGRFPHVTLTAMEDVGRFVAASLELPEGAWESTGYMVGETVRMDEVVRIAERVLEGGKWDVRSVTAEELEARLEGEEDVGKRLWLQLGLVYTRDKEGEAWLEPKLNKLFPDIKPLTVEGYLRKYYD
jgi:hypothetical protein